MEPDPNFAQVTVLLTPKEKDQNLFEEVAAALRPQLQEGKWRKVNITKINNQIIIKLKRNSRGYARYVRRLKAKGNY